MFNLSMFLNTSLKFIIIAFTLYVGLISTSQVQAEIPSGGLELDGYAWSGTIGWISLNCRSGGVGGTNICGTGPGQSNYRVRIESSGAVTGYAWSSSIGWVLFDGVTGFPTNGLATHQGSANVTGTFPELQFRGWARACAGMSEPVACTGTGTNPVSGGWDGWISFSGNADLTGQFYQVGTGPGGTMRSGSFAWGGSVVGWIDMNSSGTGRVMWRDPSAVNNITLSNCVVTLGSSGCTQTLTWTTAGLSNPSVQRLSPTPSSAVSTSSSDSLPISMVPGTTYSFEVYEDGAALAPRVRVSAVAQCPSFADVDVVSGFCECIHGEPSPGVCNPPPVIPFVPAVVPPDVMNLSLSPAIVRRGNTATINVDIGRALVAGESCTVTGGGIAVTTTGPGPFTPTSLTSSPLQNQTLFTLSCTQVASYGTVSTNATAETIASFIEI